MLRISHAITCVLLRMILRLRLLTIGGALLVCVCAGALGKGEYQQTRDGKTLVWNAISKAGDTMSWDGSRDRDGYATGFGDLTSYNSAGKVYALYYGNMVHGKFEGAVNFHIGNRTVHAYFVDGGRVTAWGRGAAPANMKVPADIVAERRKAEAEPPPPPPPKPSKTEIVAKPSPRAARETPKPTPEPEKERPVESGVSESSATPVASTPPAISEQTPEPIASASPSAFSEPTAFATSTPEITPFESISTLTPEPSATTEIKKEEASPEPRSTPNEEPSPPPVSEAATPPAEASRPRSDVSLNALVGPPTSLRSTPENSSAKSETEAASSPSGQLTEGDAINLADTEARIHGFNLSNYERPKVDHSKVKGKWTLFYASKQPEAGEEVWAPFTVTVEDKTRRVEFRK